MATNGSPTSKTWFITGASRGFGHRFAQAALGRGDRVAATARRPGALDSLKRQYADNLVVLELDVTDKEAVATAVDQAAAAFGGIDVVVNNAGLGLFGAVEELAEADIRAQFDTNFFGSLWVTQSALPHLRQQGSGHIIMLSSMLGVAGFPTTGGYTAAKAAVEGLADSLSQEVAGFGIRVTVIEPGPFATEFGSSSTYAGALPAYDEIREAFQSGFSESDMLDPAGVGPAILKVVDADNPPLRVFFGPSPLPLVTQTYADRLAEWQRWAWLSTEAAQNPDIG